MGDKAALRHLAIEEKKRADRFIATLDAANRIQTYAPLSVVPAMQWAQSPEKIFIDIKFAHRLDAPGCIEIRTDKIEFEKTHLKISAMCTMSSHQMRYVVDFDLYDEIDPEMSSYTKSSLGRMAVTLEKKTKAYWKLPMKGKKPGNMQVWWEMRARYKKDMKSYYPSDDGRD